MVRRRMKDPVQGRHKRVFGRLWVRYTCGTCGARSGWRRPTGAAFWIRSHGLKSTYCSEVVR